MPVRVRRAVRENILVMKGYCEVFGVIGVCLRDGTAPCSKVIEQQIKNSTEYDCARLFLLVGGKVEYALQHLLTRIRVTLKFGHSGTDMELLPECANDTRFGMIEEWLVYDISNSSI